MARTCRICMDPKNCTCICLMCRWARLNLIDPIKFPSMKDFMDKWASNW